MPANDASFRFQLGVPPGQSIPEWKRKAALDGKYGNLAKEWAQEMFKEKEK